MRSPSFHHTSPLATPIFFFLFFGHFNLPPLFSLPFFHLPRFLFHRFSAYQLWLFLNLSSIDFLNGNLGRDGQKSCARCWNEVKYIRLWVTADMLKRAFCPFQLSRRSQRFSICLPHPSITSDAPARAVSFLPVFPPLYCSACVYRDWLTVPSHVTRAAQVPLYWKLDTTHPLHLHPTSPTVRKKKKKKNLTWKHTCIQAQVYGNTVCKFFFYMQMWHDAAKMQM